METMSAGVANLLSSFSRATPRIRIAAAERLLAAHKNPDPNSDYVRILRKVIACKGKPYAHSREPS